MNGMLTNGLLLAMGVGVLYFGAEWLVRGATRLASALGVPPIVVGLTVVSMGTSAPELVVCLVAALRGNPDLAMGNVMGSNLANIGLILGLTAMVRPLEVNGRVVTREIPVMIAVTLALFPLIWDGQLSRPDGMILIVILALYLLFINRAAGEEVPEVVGEFEIYADDSKADAKTVAGSLALIVGGSIGLVLGGRSIVMAAEYIASAFGVPDLVIGLTLVAIGTSLPELATALVAAFRKEADIAVGNIIGSNVFNIAAILGITSTVQPIRVVSDVVREELPVVLL
ncbi:MAG: calcium/sodium antiporter, partial [Gemmatimonadetes bacterium]|nr:calcium/sodium antiporter [Gemmatimonadota bacterium]